VAVQCTCHLLTHVAFVLRCRVVLIFVLSLHVFCWHFLLHGVPGPTLKLIYGVSWPASGTLPWIDPHVVGVPWSWCLPGGGLSWSWHWAVVATCDHLGWVLAALLYCAYLA
jgi:hypothetical protein